MTANALQLRGVRKSFGDSEIIRGVDLSMYTLDAGSILLNGKQISGLPPHLIARMGLARSFQITNVFPRLSVFENIRIACLRRGGYYFSLLRAVSGLHDINRDAEELVEKVHLEKVGHKLAGTLTYSEQRALEIAMTVASGADIILLDEPMAGMSREETGNAIALVQKIASGKTMLIIEHDMDVVFKLADRISVLVYGEVIVSDVPENVRSNARVQEAYLGSDTH
jgi:branched-chain amino acid transport system ATP-binding protein